MRLSKSEAIRREYVKQMSDQRKRNHEQMRVMKNGYKQQLTDMQKSREDILKIRNRENSRQMGEIVQNYEGRMEEFTRKSRNDLLQTRETKNKAMERQKERFTEEKRKNKLAFKDEMDSLRDNYLRKSDVREREMKDFVKRTNEKMGETEARLEEEKADLEKYYEQKITKLKEGSEGEIRSLKKVLS
ncbi:MAG: hypothetical protein VYD54_06020 [Bdellovibrionota bacterium]|nr:hypothetical protein [Bdellovibrionota bacterium]